MDNVVKQAMAKWPNVPAVYGWLALDRRGRWLIKGEPVSNPLIAEFIARNYCRDTQGCWFFQNGPQRVFVELHYTPIVYRSAASGNPSDLCVETHTGKRASRIDGAWIDDEGALLLSSEHGPGLFDDRDLERMVPCFVAKRGVAMNEDAVSAAIESLQSGDASANLSLSCGDVALALLPIRAADVPMRLGYVRQPLPPPGHEVC